MARSRQYNYWLDGYVKDNLDIVQNEAIPNKWDGLFIIFGREGSGKTTFGTQCCNYLDRKFNIDICVFTPDQFTEAIENAKPESSILWDEAITGADVSLYASVISSSIISKLTQIRKKKHKIFICFPYLYKLNKYFISRCMGSFYIYAKDFDDRGYGYFYDYEQTQFLYGLMKEKYRFNYKMAINRAYKSFWFKFDKTFCLPEKKYDIKKEESRQLNDSEKGWVWKDRLGQILTILKNDYEITTKEIADKIGVKPPVLYTLTKNK